MSNFGLPAPSIDRREILIGYAAESQVSLGEHEEQRLTAELAFDDISVQFVGPSDKPVAGTWYPKAASIQIEPVNLLLVVTGGVIAKAFLQEFVKDIYKFFKDHIHRIHANKSPLNAVHYGVLIDFRHADGSRYYAAMSFRTEEDLIVNLYRLYQHLGDAPPPLSTEQRVEFTYPTPPVAYYVTCAILKMYVGGALGFVAGLLAYRWFLTLVRYTLPAGIASFALGATVMLVFGVVVDFAGNRYIRMREQRWRRPFKRDAEEWIKGIRN